MPFLPSMAIPTKSFLSKGLCKVKKIQKNLDRAHPTHPPHPNFFVGNHFQKKKCPSQTWTHPTTSIVILDFWRKTILCKAPKMPIDGFILCFSPDITLSMWSFLVLLPAILRFLTSIIWRFCTHLLMSGIY